nr:uncharacterized protein LOC112721285 [Arachis hypogaea]
MADEPEEHSISRQDNSRTRNPTPENQEPILQGRIASTIHNKENNPAKTQNPRNPKDKSAQIIRELCHKVQELEGRVANKERHNAEHGSHATSRSRSRHGRSPEWRHAKRHDRSTSRNRSPERRHSKRYNRSISRDPAHTDDDR